MSTKTTIVPSAVLYFGFLVQVQELALLVATLRVLGVEIALGHFAHVVLVQELAVVAFLAQAAQPMLAYNCLVACLWAH